MGAKGTTTKPTTSTNSRFSTSKLLFIFIVIYRNAVITERDVSSFAVKPRLDVTFCLVKLKMFVQKSFKSIKFVKKVAFNVSEFKWQNWGIELDDMFLPILTKLISGKSRILQWERIP